jgi:predicted nucleic acid-binding Zn ribbon protein
VSRSWMPQSIADEVRRELSRYGPAAGMAELVSAWPELVGEEVARNSWPARIARDGTLHVHTSSSAWAFELSQLAPTILERLREALPEISPPALRFAVGHLPELDPPTAERAGPEVPRPGPRERAAAAELTASLTDPELRELVARAAAASLAKSG